MRLSRLLVSAGAALVLIIVAASALTITMVRQVQQQAQTLQGALTSIAQEARSGDVAAVVAALPEAELSARALQSSTSGPIWQAATAIPLLGGTASSIATLADATGDVLASTTDLQRVLGGTEGTADLIATLPDLLSALGPIRAATLTARSSLDAIDAGGLLLDVGPAIEQAREQLSAVDDAAGALVDHGAEIESALGFDGPRTYLVMLQNPAEARGSGGLFSAFMRLTLDRGTIRIDEANSRKVLDEEQIPIPRDIDPGERQLWGDYLTEWASFNVSPDFPTTAMLATAGMQARGTPVDGVIAIDPATVEAILAGTGPVEHKGITIDSTNAYDFFTKGIYEDFPGFDDVEAKDDLALGLLYATVDSVLNRPLDLPGLTSGLQASATEGHIRAWLPSVTEEAWLAELGLAHDLATLAPNAQLAFINNATGGKVDAYVTTGLEIDQRLCRAVDEEGNGITQQTSTVTVTNDAPAVLPEYVDVRLDDETAPDGSTRLLTTLVGPKGATEVSANGAGDFSNVRQVILQGRPTWTADLDLPRGESRTLEVVMTTPQAPSDTLPPCGQP